MTVMADIDTVSTCLPQWSPLLGSGMTFFIVCLAPERPVAAMEPAPWERDDAWKSLHSVHKETTPQWSPILGSGMTPKPTPGPGHGR